MNRLSRYYPLSFVVECGNASNGMFEPIAAFNYDGAALGYALDCSKDNRELAYRVMSRTGHTFTLLARFRNGQKIK